MYSCHMTGGGHVFVSRDKKEVDVYFVWKCICVT